MHLDTRVGAYAVIVEAGRVLLTHWQLAPSERMVLTAATSGWTLPGGGLEPGEEPAGAMVREVLEETGFRVEPLALLGTDSAHFTAAERMPGAPARPLHSLRLVYLARITGGALRVEENGSTDDARWVELDGVDELPRVSLVDAALQLWRAQLTTTGNGLQGRPASR